MPVAKPRIRIWDEIKELVKDVVLDEDFKDAQDDNVKKHVARSSNRCR